MQFDYVAKRSIQGGHVVDTAYTITVDISESQRTARTEGNQAISLSGNTVSTIHRGDIIQSITTVLIDATTTPDIDDMREFLDSVKYGEQFQIDTFDYIMDSFGSAYTEAREHPNKFRYSFAARYMP